MSNHAHQVVHVLSAAYSPERPDVLGGHRQVHVESYVDFL